MLLFSSALAKPKLTFVKLRDYLCLAPLAAKWAEDEWGYIRKKGVQYREELLRSLSDNIYMGVYAGQPIAMFGLFNHEHLPNTRELMYVYVEKKYRGLGFGKQIIEEAKRLAALSGAELILLDTLKSNLNRLYEKHGAELVCEGRLFSQPTDVLAIRL